MRRKAQKEKRLAAEQDTVAMQRAERAELDSLASPKKREANALRELERQERVKTARRVRPGKPPQR